MKNIKNENQKLNLQDRLLIENLRNEEGKNISKISRILHKTRKTIRSELNRCKGKYNAVKANNQALRRQRYKTRDWKKIVSLPSLLEYIKYHLKLDWSPEEISGRLKNIDTEFDYVSTKSIYDFVYSVHGRQLEKISSLWKKEKEFFFNL